jgi:hypothetical protein
MQQLTSQYISAISYSADPVRITQFDVNDILQNYYVVTALEKSIEDIKSQLNAR